MWDLIVSVPGHCLSFYLKSHERHLQGWQKTGVNTGFNRSITVNVG